MLYQICMDVKRAARRTLRWQIVGLANLHRDDVLRYANNFLVITYVRSSLRRNLFVRDHTILQYTMSMALDKLKSCGQHAAWLVGPEIILHIIEASN